MNILSNNLYSMHKMGRMEYAHASSLDCPMADCIVV